MTDQQMTKQLASALDLANKIETLEDWPGDVALVECIVQLRDALKAKSSPNPDVSLVHSEMTVPCIGFEIYKDKTRGLTLGMPENMPLTIGEHWVIRRVPKESIT